MTFEDDYDEFGEEEFDEDEFDEMSFEEQNTLREMQKDFYAPNPVNFNCEEKSDAFGGGEEMDEGEWIAFQKSLGLSKEFLTRNVYPRYQIAHGEEDD